MRMPQCMYWADTWIPVERVNWASSPEERRRVSVESVLKLAQNVHVKEVDLLLHPLMSELNFPVGAREPLDLSPERWELPMHLLQPFLCVDTDVVAKAPLGRSAARRSRRASSSWHCASTPMWSWWGT
ncbi:unnamed protein product [Symbiodinium sp. CCMP2592]|nr:unnamed protein product [Symbiodinium sp. CCMP2592]